MSDISTNLSMKEFGSDVLTYSIFNLKLIILFIITLVMFSFFSGILQHIYTYTCKKHEKCNCTEETQDEDNTTEQFGNDKFYSYKDVGFTNYTTYQSASLTPLDESLNFGQVNRYIKGNEDGSKSIELILDVYCNLYLLNANPFGMDSIISKPTKQSYLVYLRKNKDRKLIGKLNTGSDQVYKLKFKSDKPEDFINFNIVDIVYSDKDDKETTIMSGRFTLA